MNITEIINNQITLLHEESKKENANVIELTNSMANLLNALANTNNAAIKKDAPVSQKVV